LSAGPARVSALTDSTTIVPKTSEGTGISEPTKQSAPEPKTKRKISWFYSVLPFSVASGPLSTFIQLALLHYYGQNTGTVDIGLITTVYNGITIPAAMIWGFTTDRTHKRKPIIALSFILVGIDLTALFFTRSALGIGLVYSIFGLFASASATPFNLLIMETQPKNSWAAAFATFSMIGTLGNVIGLLLSLVWVAFLPFEWLILPLAALSLLSAGLSALLVQEPSFVFERQMIVMQKPSFSHRLLAVPLMFLHVPRPHDFNRVFNGLRHELTSQVPILYLSIVAFNIAGGIFNTSLTPAMSRNGLSQSDIYLVYLVAMIVQVIAFRFAAPIIARRTLVKTATGGLVLRSMCYAAMGISVYLISGLWFIVPSIVFYPIAAGVAYAIYYTSSSTMVFNSLGSKGHGSSLGVYSALVGVATMAGSLISGFTSVYLGYYVTFMLAAFFLATAAILTSRLARFEQQSRTTQANVRP
jgi:MFS family permease